MFNDVYYKQVDGVAMWLPLGPTLANLLLVYQKSKWLENCPAQFKPQFYRIYVDDILTMFKKKDHVKKLILTIVILNSPAKKKKTTKYRFQTFPPVEVITHWKHLSSVNLHLVESALILIVSYQQNIKLVCCTHCYTEHITLFQLFADSRRN